MDGVDYHGFVVFDSRSEGTLGDAGSGDQHQGHGHAREGDARARRQRGARNYRRSVVAATTLVAVTEKVWLVLDGDAQWSSRRSYGMVGSVFVSVCSARSARVVAGFHAATRVRSQMLASGADS